MSMVSRQDDAALIPAWGGRHRTIREVANSGSRKLDVTLNLHKRNENVSIARQATSSQGSPEIQLHLAG
jgi:hypothetical protein